MKIKLLHILFILVLVGLVFTGCKEDSAGQNGATTDKVAEEKRLINEPRWVTSDAGLRIRERPVDGDKIGAIPYQGEVLLLEEIGDDVTIADATGKWSRIKYQDIEGWVFGGFLSSENPFEEVALEIVEKEMWVTGVDMELISDGGAPIKVIPHGTKVTVYYDNQKDDIVYMGLPGRWLSIKEGDDEGVFYSAFLSEKQIESIELNDDFLIGEWARVKLINNGIILNEEATTQIIFKKDYGFIFITIFEDGEKVEDMRGKWKLENNYILFYKAQSTGSESPETSFTARISKYTNNIFYIYSSDQENESASMYSKK